MPLPPWLHPDGDGSRSRLEVHAVPGARRDGFAGVHGERLKIRTAAPPEGGRANEAIRDLIAHALGIPARDVELRRGAAARAKTFLVALDAATVASRLGSAV